MIPVERTHEYRGRYHVLGGALSPIDGVEPEDLKIAELYARVERADPPVREVVLATNPTTTGEATALHIADGLRAPGAGRGGHPPGLRPAGRRRPGVRRRGHPRPRIRRPPRALTERARTGTAGLRTVSARARRRRGAGGSSRPLRARAARSARPKRARAPVLAADEPAELAPAQLALSCDGALEHVDLALRGSESFSSRSAREPARRDQPVLMTHLRVLLVVPSPPLGARRRVAVALDGRPSRPELVDSSVDGHDVVATRLAPRRPRR